MAKPNPRSLVAASGDTQQAVTIDHVRYSHIVDPQTALGLTHRIAVTIIGPDAATTDSLATGDITETRSSGFPDIKGISKNLGVPRAKPWTAGREAMKEGSGLPD